MTTQQVIGTFIALVIGVFVSDDARKRGMSQLGWGAFVFLFMIVGLPLYLFKRKPLLEEQNEE